MVVPYETRRHRQEVCEALARKFFPAERYEIRWVGWKEKEGGEGYVCVVDFVRKSYEPEFDCAEYCEMAAEYYAERFLAGERGEGEEAYEACVNTCEFSLEKAVVSSVEFDPETLKVRTSTIAGTCYWVAPSADGEEFFEEKEKMISSVEGAGCEYADETWIHPHELVDLGLELEEEPAVCYYHLRGCPLPTLLRVAGEWF